MAVLEVNGLKKVYTTRFGGSRVQALTNVTFAVERGEYVAIMGESGSGKTTLLNILAALDRPTEGEVFLNGRALSTIGEKEIASFRRQNLGFVFQDFNLLDTFTLQDNIFLHTDKFHQCVIAVSIHIYFLQKFLRSIFRERYIFLLCISIIYQGI